MYKNKKIKNAQPTVYNNIKFRSKLEAECARIMDEKGIEYKYEPFSIELMPSFQYEGKSYRAWTYSPDFIVFNSIIIEIKGFPNDLWGVKKKMILKYIVDNNYIYEFYEVKNTNQLLKLIEELKQREQCKENLQPKTYDSL